MNKRPNPGPWVYFVFAMIMWITLFMFLGIFSGDNYLLYGTISAVSLPFWIKAAKDYYAMEDPYMDINGHLFMAFGILFGGMIGFGYLAAALGHIFPNVLLQDEKMFGLMYLVAGVYMIPMLPSLLYMDKVSCITWTVCTFWLLDGGLLYFFPNSLIIYYINIVGCALMTLGVTWMLINEVCLMCYGKGAPMGKPFKSYPEE